MRRCLTIIVGLLLLPTVSLEAFAQTARSGGGASAQALQQLQQLAGERTQLQADNEKLKKELDSMRQELADLKSGQDRRLRVAQADAARSVASGVEASRELEVQRGRMQELLQKSREIVDTLRTVETDRNANREKLVAREGELGACVDRNRELYKLNGEVLQQLERRGGRGEPFTQLSRVRLENLIDGYRFRAEEQVPPSQNAVDGPQ